MFCKNCGRRLGEDAKFCGGCGTPVSVTADDNTVQPEPAQETVQPEPVQETVQPEPAQEIVQPEPTQETVQPEPAQETVQPEPTQETVQPEPAQETAQPEPAQETVQPEPAQETVQPEPAQETAQPEPAQETVQPEPAQETAQPEPVQETVQSEPAQETVQSELAQESVKPISAVIAQMAGEQKAETAAIDEPTTESAQPIAGSVSETPKNPLPESFSEAVGEQAAASPKKKKGKVGLIIGGTAIVLAGAAAAVGYFCFSNQIMRLIKGDAGYAKEIALKSYSDYILGGEEFDFGAVDDAIAARIEAVLLAEQARETGYQNREIISIINNTSSFDRILELYGDSEIKITADVEFYSFLKAILDGNDSVSEYLDAMRGISLVSHVQSGENGNKYTYAARFKDSDIFCLEQYRSEELTTLTMPNFCDYTFYMESENGENSITIPREEIERIRNEMYKIADEAYSSAKFTYTDGEFTVAGIQVKGTEVKTVFSNELCGDILKKWGEFLKNDEFLRNFYVSASSKSVSEYEKLFSSENIDPNMQITVCNYIAPHTEIIGKTIIVTDTSEDGESFAAGLVNNKGEFRIIADIPGGGQFSVISATEDDVLIKDATGTIKTEISYVDGTDGKPLVLDLICEDCDNITYCGKSVRTGKYTLSLSDKDEMLSSILTESRYSGNDITGEMMSLSDSGSSAAIIKEALKCAKISWSLDGDESRLNAEFSINVTSILSLRFNAELTPYTSGEAVEIPDISGEKCIDLAEEMDEKTLNSIRLNISEKMLEALDKNDVLRDIADKMDLIDSLQKNIDEMKRGERMSEHYSYYTESSAFDANRYARHIYDEFAGQFWKDGNALSDSDIEKYPVVDGYTLFNEPRTIKLYNGEQGLEVIDDAGLGFVDFENVMRASGADDSKNMYIELTFDIAHALSDYTYSYDEDFLNVPVLTGVCVVYTDDPSDLPSALPDTYNYIDGVFEWGGMENVKDDFVVGTYPNLIEGISTAREDEENFAKEKEKLDSYALNISKAVQLFMQQNAGVFELENANEFSVELRAGSWEILSGYDEYARENDEIAELAKKSGLSEYLGNFSRLNSISDVRVQLLFMRDSYFRDYFYDEENANYENDNYSEQQADDEMKLIGIAVVNAAENVVFSDYYVPDYYNYVYGSSSFNNYSSIYPAAGKLYLDDSYYVPFGSWCSSTGTALSNGY